uniref:Uncharacterized protein n=1 Tax=Physcomitrium patens TaxID=3218 RepID=A0A2K1KJ30_PHYPA|nr:hypothetical protein PHYPA_007454 [Physcomitrium patens]
MSHRSAFFANAPLAVFHTCPALGSTLLDLSHWLHIIGVHLRRS